MNMNIQDSLIHARDLSRSAAEMVAALVHVNDRELEAELSRTATNLLMTVNELLGAEDEEQLDQEEAEALAIAETLMAALEGPECDCDECRSLRTEVPEEDESEGEEVVTYVVVLA